MSTDEEIQELLATYHHMANKLTVITALISLGSLAQEDYAQMREATLELANGLEDARAAIRRLSEKLTGTRRGTGELKAQ